MRAGALDRRISLQSTIIARDPDSGAARETFATFAEVAAGVNETPGREFLSANQPVAERRAVFSIRWREDVDVRDRVLWEGVAFNITGLRELGRRQGLELHAVAVS